MQKLEKIEKAPIKAPAEQAPKLNARKFNSDQVATRVRRAGHRMIA
jgi:hypothetical protein